MRVSFENILSNAAAAQDLLEITEEEINRLSSDMERMKQIIGQNTTLDNVVEISTELKNPKETVIRELVIKLDGYQVYKLNPDVGLWVPRTTIPIYTGPLKQGKHKVNISARLARVVGKDLPIDDNTFNIITQEFTINVPSGKFQKGYKISIKKPVKDTLNTKADVIEYNL